GGDAGGARRSERPPAYPAVLTDPCCIPALGGWSEIPSRGGLRPILRSQSRLAHAGPVPVPSYVEDSHSGLVRSLGKRVGLTPSGVRIPYPPPRRNEHNSRDPHASRASRPTPQPAEACLRRDATSTTRATHTPAALVDRHHSWRRLAAAEVRGAQLARPTRQPR